MGVPEMEWYLLVIGLAVLIGLYILMVWLYKPLGLLFRLALCAITGIILLILSNFFLGFVDIRLALNPFTILVAGVLQLPGIIMLIIIALWFT